jgi:elongation factor Ts
MEEKNSLIEKIKKLREETGISISECQKALKESGGDLEKAKELLKKAGQLLAQKKAERETKHGVIEAYIHPNKKIGAMIELLCESDFVANLKEFQHLAHEICLQVAAISPEEQPLMEQDWIKDPTKKIKELIEEHIAKFGENIVVGKVFRTKI